MKQPAARRIARVADMPAKTAGDRLPWPAAVLVIAACALATWGGLALLAARLLT
ncbi:hypothetical protein [Falsiroseomonas oryzae]|uniref:hypothetical protein n=1 Tax=Falsiroseomonas oryzae TaxID=2766473 RepID=UPI0022EA2E0A|nr:hypothetical protein [Roseomonas sp. MO-31]